MDWWFAARPEIAKSWIDISEKWDRTKQRKQLAAELTKLAAVIDASITAGMRPTRKVQETLFDPHKE